MPDGIRWVGLDVHARESTFAIFDQATGEVTTKRVMGRPHELLVWLRAVERPARMVYEAGPTGYGLARRALAEGIELSVCAPSKTERPSDRIKTDQRDAVRLAKLLAASELVLVTIPSVEREQLRDLVRCREDIRVFFTTREKLTPDDTDGQLDIYRRESDASTIRSSAAAGGGGANGAFDATFLGASPDGVWWWWQTSEPIDTVKDTDSVSDIYLSNFGAGTALASGGSMPPWVGDSPVIYGGASDEGDHIFFDTLQPLTADDIDGQRAMS